MTKEINRFPANSGQRHEDSQSKSWEKACEVTRTAVRSHEERHLGTRTVSLSHEDSQPESRGQSA
eukprot:924737-Rhodomonas_salina.1